MDETTLKILELATAITVLTTAIHKFGLASLPLFRALLSILPLDVVGAIRRYRGLAGAKESPNVGEP